MAHTHLHYPTLRICLRVLAALVVVLCLSWAAPASARTIVHVVRSGQNVGMIAKRYHTSSKAIERRNNLKSGYKLRVGQRLRIDEVSKHRRWRQYVEKKNAPPEKKATQRKKTTRSSRSQTRAKPKATSRRKRKRSRKQALRKRAPKKTSSRKKPRSRKRASKDKRAPKKRRARKKNTTKQASTRAKNSSKRRRKATTRKKGSTVAAARPPLNRRKRLKKNRSRKRAGKGDGRTRSASNAKQRTQKHDAGKGLHLKYKRKPRRKGRVTLVRHGQRFRGQLVDRRGRIVSRSARRVDRLLRSRRTGEKHKIDRRLVKLLTRASDYFGGRTIVVVSGYRPYSKKQYTRNSRHNHGKAVDFRVVGVPNRALYEFCRTLPKVGCGYYPNSVFVHMDVRNYKTQWTDYSRPGQKPIYAHRLKRKREAAAKAARAKARRKKARKKH